MHMMSQSFSHFLIANALFVKGARIRISLARRKGAIKISRVNDPFEGTIVQLNALNEMSSWSGRVWWNVENKFLPSIRQQQKVDGGNPGMPSIETFQWVQITSVVSRPMFCYFTALPSLSSGHASWLTLLVHHMICLGLTWNKPFSDAFLRGLLT
jgi:hypothetical protein